MLERLLFVKMDEGQDSDRVSYSRPSVDANLFRCSNVTPPFARQVNTVAA